MHSECADLKCDITRLVFASDYADRIAAIHVIEHFYYWDVADILQEWKRVLKPGGRLILELPCMDKVFGHIAHRLMKGVPPDPIFSWLPIWGDPKYRRPEMCHKWGYFMHDIMQVLKRAGFSEIKFCDVNYHFPQRDMRVEAVKPQEI